MYTLLFLLLHSFSFAGDGQLPTYNDMRTLRVDPVPFGKKLIFSANITIPNNHKTKSMPSVINIYEKIQNKWIKRDSLDSFSFLLIGDKINTSKTVQLESESSDLAIDSTIYHCGKYCVINNFQGIIKRSKSAKNPVVNLKINGYLPDPKTSKMKI